MKSAIFLLFVSNFFARAVEPVHPRTAWLDKDSITDIVLHEKVTTVLSFPETVTMVTGYGLTDGAVDGLFQIDHPKGTGNIVLRSMGQEGKGLMQVIADGQVYAFRLMRSETPDSIVRMQPKKSEQLHSESSDPVFITEERIRQLLAESTAVDSTSGLTVKSESNLWCDKDVEILTETISRSASDDAVIARGRIRNLGNVPINLVEWKASLLVSQRRRMAVRNFKAGRQYIGPGESVDFIVLAAGTENGQRSNFSIANRFDLVIEPKGNQKKDQ